MQHVLKPVDPQNTQDSAILSRYPKGPDGKVLELFRIFANSSRFLGEKGVRNMLDVQSPIGVRERELIILRVTAKSRCEYEWGVHAAIFGGEAGFGEEQLKATLQTNAYPACWSAKETLLLRVVDELMLNGRLTGETLPQFRSSWSCEEQLEIAALCANYQLVSYVAGISELPLEAYGARFDGYESRL